MSLDRIKELEKSILKARNDYYNHTSTVSDQVYDAWVDELSVLDPKNLAVTSIGYEPVSNWEKFQHVYPMGSLNKCQTHEEFVKWSTDHIHKNDKIFVTTKLDGLSVSLMYENGILVKAATRGSGEIGELITPNVAKMNGVPLRLRKKVSATIRGEIVLSKDNHKKYFADYSNARNAASGISRRYDGEGCQYLDVLVYQIFTDDVDITSQQQQFEELTNLGLTAPVSYLLTSNAEILELKNKYQSSLRDLYPYDMDGLVAHQNDLVKLDSFGIVNNRPKGSIAIKFDSVAREAYVAQIMNQVGNSGRITPVAVFSPKVQLMGAEVEKASLHNFSNIAALGIDVGAKVLVCRSNDVIPYVQEVVSSTGTVFDPPTHCPECGAPTMENGEYLQCTNTMDCPAQVSGRIRNWIKELNILEWGDGLITKLVESGKVKTVADLYKLSVDDLSQIERMGKKSATKCHQMLWSNVEIPLETFLGALSIPMIGASTIKAIMSDGYGSLNQFFQTTAESFEQINGVGPSKAASLRIGLQKNKELISDLLQNGIKIKEKVQGKLSGCKIAITGSTNLKRAELEKMIMDHGGEYKSAVNKTCSHLLIADVNSTSSKAVAARKLGCKLISEEDFLSLIK
jgi:DNA ligase (NAD+)